MRIRHAESLPPFQKNALILGFQHETESRASRTEVATGWLHRGVRRISGVKISCRKHLHRVLLGLEL